MIKPEWTVVDKSGGGSETVDVVEDWLVSGVGLSRKIWKVVWGALWLSMLDVAGPGGGACGPLVGAV